MKKQPMTHIRDILGQALENFRPSADMEMTRLWSLWDTAVGTAIAQNAKPGMFKDGVLMVNVSSSVWMQQLRFHKPAMVTSLNSALGKDLVKDIRFKIASLHN
ncbi:MAG: DUF721 domain-containing protein [Pseudomonadota bacterium]